MSFCIFSAFLYLVVLFHLNTLRVLSNPWIFLILFCVFLSVFFKSCGACTQSHRTLALVLFKVQWKTWHAFILSSKLAGRCFPEQPRSILHLCRSLLGSDLRLWTLFYPLLYSLLFFFSPGVRWCSHCVIRLPFTCTNCGLDKLTSSEVPYQWKLILTKTHMHTNTHRGRPCPILRVIPPLALCVFCFVLSAGFQEISPPSRFGQTGWPI